MGITTTYKQIAFAVLCCLWAVLYSPAAHAQNPPCAVAGDAGNAYESCASGFCERLICNGSAYATLSGRNFSGWESIKFGNDTSTCNSARSGRLRYAGGSTWEYCNGSAWTSLTGGGSLSWPQSVTSATGGDVFQITGSNHNFLGFSTDGSNTSVFLGREAGNSATTLTGNTFIGYRAGTVTTNSYNTFVGFQTGLANTSGSANAFLGVQTGMGNTTGNSNTFLGSWVGQSNTTGSANTFVGNEAGTQNTTAGQNTFVGAYAGRNNTASQNTFIGHQSGLYNTAGTNSVVLGTGAAMGPSAGYILGTESTIIGYQAGASTATGSVGNFNTFIGGGSGLSNTTGTNNAFVGASSGRNNTTAGASTFVGALSGENNNGMANTFIGTFSGRDNTTGGQNVFIGSSAGRYNIIGASNTFIGHQAGSYIANGTTPLTAPTENILIGNSARGLTDTSSRFMNIGGAFYGTYDTDGVYAFGDNEAQLFVDGILGVGYSNPTCNSTYAGYIRYNSPNMEYCNGTAWTSLSGVSSGSTFLTGSGTNVINPVSPSAAGGLTIPANAISTTKPFEVVVFGNYSQTNVSTSRYIALSISYGATTSSGVDGGPVSATIAEGSFVYRATIRATTTTAATIAEELMVYNASGNVGFTRIKVQNYAIPSITSSNILYINVSMTPGHAGNIMKATAYHVEY